MAKILLDHGADPNAVNRFGMTPLFEAAMNCKVESVQLLLDHGATVGVVDNDGVHFLKIANNFMEIACIVARYLNPIREDPNKVLILILDTRNQDTVRIRKLTIQNPDFLKVGNQMLRFWNGWFG